MKTLFFALVCALVASASSFADHKPGHHGHGMGMGMGHGPCAEDIKKYCSDVKMGDHDAMKKCMESNQDKLSEGCKTHHMQMMAKMAEVKAACKDDMEKLCKDVKDGEPHAMHECMMKHKKEMSQGCKDAHKKMKAEMKEHKKDAKKGGE